MKISRLKFKKIYNKTLEDITRRESLLANEQKKHGETSTKRKRSFIESLKDLEMRPSTPKSKRIQSARTEKNIPKILPSELMQGLEEDLMTKISQNNFVDLTVLKGDFENILEVIQSHEANIEHNLKKFEDEMSRKLHSRISHLVFFLIYAHYLEVSHRGINGRKMEDIEKLEMSEYYCRKLLFCKTTFFICLKIQELLCLKGEYDESKEYARKCLRLAVFMKNRDYQFQIIENFKIINYYNGVIEKYSENYISESQRKIIREKYRLEDQLPKIFEGKENDGLWNHVFDFEKEGYFIQKPQFSKNYNNFIKNYHFINKDIPPTCKNIKKTVKKVAKVGVVHKYIGMNNFIVLEPRSPSLANKHQSQVYLTHRKFTYKESKDQRKEALNSVKQFKGMLQRLINSFNI